MEDRIQNRQLSIADLKRNKSLDLINQVLTKSSQRSKYIAWQLIAEKASGYIKKYREIRDMFEMIEQEKAVLEEEYGTAITLNEDLQL